MQFNQVNQNKGDVNNAIAQNGNVVQSVGNTGEVNNAATTSGAVAQTVGNGNRVKVDQPKESFWAQAWKKVVRIWKKVFGG
ncbi:MAG: hypothetical protein KF777_03990 [Planctomycetaceae bacterium]|nr:hypothetical protein [Planctomycetaceae bacterium]